MPPQQGQRRFDLVRCLLDLSAHGGVPSFRKSGRNMRETTRGVNPGGIADPARRKSRPENRA
jgi:hypothetical protein